MISFYPSEKETRLVVFTQEQLNENLQKFIKPLKGEVQKKESKDFLFYPKNSSHREVIWA